MITKARFIGAHFWLAPEGAAFTSPAPGNITQDGAWPDEAEAEWDNWKLGVCESFSIDPKYGPQEDVLAPSPGAVKLRDTVIPYAIPEIKFTLLQDGPLSLQLALNTQKLFATGTTQFNPNGGGGPGQRGILWAQKYDHENVALWTFVSWIMISLDGPLEGAPKTMTKPKFMARLMDSDNNTGEIDP
jgi:hypothetical protein